MKLFIDLTKLNCVHGIVISKFPDSQINVEIKNLDYSRDNVFQIKSRFSSYEDLMKILATNQVLQDAGFKTELYCPYILSSRSDGKFKPNQSFDLKIVAQILNSCNFEKIIVIDAHSGVLPALINKCINIPASGWIEKVEFDWNNKVLVSPDAGAYKKIFSLADKLNCELLAGSKVRIPNGAPQVVIHGNVQDRDCVIVDDICDGGRTFVELGKLLKEMGAKSVTLFVTHGIFSKGIQLENVDSIYTTNSYREFNVSPENPVFHVINIF